MDADLRDLLAAYLGGEIDPARYEPLLARLAADPAFRRAAAAELATLGRLKAVQSPEPRWLRLADELGAAPADAERARRVEDAVMRRVGRPRRRLGLPDRAWAAAGWAWAAACLVVGAYLLTRPAPRAAGLPADAVVLASGGVEWEAGSSRPQVGASVPSGPLRFRAGRLTLTLANGVVLDAEGPADVALASADHVTCKRGRLRVRVPPGARGFTASAPGCRVVDLGTEFALTAEADGRAAVAVFEGRVRVTALTAGRADGQSDELGPGSVVEVDPEAGTVRAVAYAAERFAAAAPVSAPPLPLAAGYADAVRAAGPWGYWRFEAGGEGGFPNEVAGGTPLKAAGAVRASDGPAGTRSAVFAPGHPGQRLVAEGPWVPSRARGYSVELWAMPEGFQSAVAAVLVPRDARPGESKHLLLTEFLAREAGSLLPPGVVRAQHRWPGGVGGGVNVFSGVPYRPGRWHHLVAQRSGDRLELYLDGRPAGDARLDPTDAAPCRVLVGRLTDDDRDPAAGRPFAGRLDELALYDRPLTPAEVRAHAALGGLPAP